MIREQILKGRVKVGQNATYQIADPGYPVKMVSFIDASGNVLSGGYTHLHIACASDEYLSLEFTRHRVTVKGMSLAKISRAISAHRLVYLCESRERVRDDGEPVVHKMLFVMKNQPEDLGDYAARSE